MAKITLPSVASGYNVSTINANFQALAAELNNKVLYRANPAGEANQVTTDIDMNSKRLLNLPAPTSDLEPLRRIDAPDISAQSAAAIVAAAQAEISKNAAAVSASSSASSASSASASAGLASSYKDTALAARDAALGYSIAAYDNSRLTVGTVTTADPGDPALVSIDGSPGTQVISFTLPRGEAGPEGPQGPPGPIGAGTGDVIGPASSVIDHIPLFNSTDGKLLKTSGVPLSSKQDALGFTPENVAKKGAANGYAPLGADSKVPAINLPPITPDWASITGKPTTIAGYGITDAYKNPGIVNLTTFMDSVYGVGVWTQRTGVGTGSDIGPALVAACTFLRSSYGRGTIVIPPGTWLMTTSPTAAEWSGNYIIGAGSQASIIVYNANSGAAFNFSGAAGFTGGGIKGIGLHLESGYPTSTSTAILLEGNATYQPDQMLFEDLYITALGASYWFDGFKAFGNARTSPQGIRGTHMSHIQVFRCSNTGIFLSNVVQLTGVNVGCYAGTGLGNNIYLAGGGTGSTNSTQVTLHGIAVVEANFTNVTKFNVSGSATTVGAGTSASLGDVSLPGATLVGTFGATVRLYN